MTSWLQQSFYVATQDTHVATKDTHVATITRQLQQTMSRHCQIISLQNPRRKHKIMSRQKRQATTKAGEQR